MSPCEALASLLQKLARIFSVSKSMIMVNS